MSWRKRGFVEKAHRLALWHESLDVFLAKFAYKNRLGYKLVAVAFVPQAEFHFKGQKIRLPLLN